MNKITKYLPLVFSIIAIVIAVFCKPPTKNYEQQGQHKQLTISDVITPRDLGIQKHVFRAKPAKDEVVLLECEKHFEGKLVNKIINYIHTDQKIHEETLLVITKDRFSANEAFENYKNRFTHFYPDNVEIKCSGFIENFNHLNFQGSQSATSSISFTAGAYTLGSNSNSVEFHYLDNQEDVAESAGLKCHTVDFYFKMTTIPYSEAKKRQPELNDMEIGKNWRAQYVERGKNEQRRNYNKAREASLKSQLEFQR